MEWVERLNQSIAYIEEHLTSEIDYERLGQIACCSAYHYQRMFTYMAGVTLVEYVRRRRMSFAPDIEVYLNSDPENSRYEVWIPVRKKQLKWRTMWKKSLICLWGQLTNASAIL